MAYRMGNNYLIAAFKRVDYATVPASYATPTVINNIMDFPIQTPQPVELAQKPLGRLPRAEQTVAGRVSASATISGTLTSGHTLLLEGITVDASSPYTIDGSVYTPFVWDIYQVFPDGKANVIYCAAMESLEITVNPGADVVFTANYRGKSVAEEVDTTALTDFPNYAALKTLAQADYFKACGFSLGKLFGGTGYDATDVQAFSISLSNEFEADETNFGMGCVKQREVLNQFLGTVSFSVFYDTAAVDIPSTLLFDDTYSSTEFTLTTVTKSWTFAIKGQYETPLTLPDPTNSLFKMSGEQAVKLVSTETTPVTITVTTL